MADKQSDERLDSGRWFVGRLGNSGVQWWLAANLVAMVFGVTHALLDAFFVIPPEIGVVLAVAVTTLVIIWWTTGLVLLVAPANRGRRALAGVWVGAVFVFLNGLSIVACPPPCGGSFGIGDVAHIGSLLSSVVVAVLTLRFMRSVRPGRAT